MRRYLLLALLPITLLVSACSDDTPEAAGCIEGASQTCACTDGSMGAQSCNADGAFDPCVCDPGTMLDAGNDDSGATTRNACGGSDDLTMAPGEPCGDCLDGLLICDGPNAVRCVGQTDFNACGGCAGLRGAPGETCGPCGETGAWQCEGANSVTCVGAASINACGGCGSLSGDYRDSCDNGDGFLTCTSEDDLVCVPIGSNRCGGTGPLSGRPGAACGECLLGKYSCDGTDTVLCDDSTVVRNECGGCGPLPAERGSACGSCGGTVVCDGSEGVRCDASINACGGCGSLAELPGSPCPDGQWVCDGMGGVTCSGSASNACGGNASLTDTPGDSCGPCNDGVVICAALNLTTCVDESATNRCGGCSQLARQPGEVCGPEEIIACDGEESVICTEASDVNACGGTDELTGTRGDLCGDCGVLECAGPNSLTCQNEDVDPEDRFNCGICGLTCVGTATCEDDVCTMGQPGTGEWIDLDLGRAHGCGLTDDGDVYCWGDNSFGQLGIGGQQPRAEPQLVPVVQSAVDIAVDEDYSCAIEMNGTLLCWGTSLVPEVFGSSTASTTLSTPTVVSQTLPALVQIDAADHTICGITPSGSLKCWGDNEHNKVGYTQPASAAPPGSDVGILTSVAQVSVGEDHVCALQNDLAYCWGSDLNGRLGDGTTVANSDIPARVELTGQSFSDISAGKNHTCGISNDDLYCWGADTYSQVSFSNAKTPFMVSSVGFVTNVEAGAYTSFALRATGALVGWGWTDSGRLGNGDSTGTYSPNTVPIVSDTVIDIALSDRWGCVIDSANQVRCWGSPPLPEYSPVLLDGQLTPSAPQYSPTTSPFVGGSSIEICNDGVDNDGDNQIDCDDDDCISGRITGATTVMNEPFVDADKNILELSGTTCGSSDGIEKRYLWTADASATFRLDASGTSGPGTHSFYVRDNCSAGLGTQLACDSYDAQLMEPPGYNEFTAVSGRTYVITVELTSIGAYDPERMTPEHDSYSFTISQP